MGPGSPLGDISAVKSSGSTPQILSNDPAFGERVSAGAQYLPSLRNVWAKIAKINPQLIKELNPTLELATGKAIFSRTGSLVGALSQMCANAVLGTAEHVQGIGIITAGYKLTQAGMASEVTVRNPDGFSATRTFLFKDLVVAPIERLALNPNYRPISAVQTKQLLDMERSFLENPNVHTGAIVSLGHQEGSDRNWMYVFLRDPKDPTLVNLVAIRLPDDQKEALDFRDRMLTAAGLGEFIPKDGARSDAVTLTGNTPTITLSHVSAASKNGLFGISAEEISALSGNGFDGIQLRQSAEIEALTRSILDELDLADLDTVEEKFELAMQLLGRYILISLNDAQMRAQTGNYYDFGPDGSGGGGGAAGPATADASVGIEEASAESGLEWSSLDLTELAVADQYVDQWEGGASADSEFGALTDQAQDDLFTSAEVESGDDEGYQPVLVSLDELGEELAAARSEDEEEEQGEEESEDDERSNGLLSTLSEDGEEVAERELALKEEQEEQDTAQALIEEQLDEQARLRELIEELGGDVSLLSTESAEVSPLGLLIAEGELPAFSQVGEYHELLLAAEITDAVSSDFEDEYGESAELLALSSEERDLAEASAESSELVEESSGDLAGVDQARVDEKDEPDFDVSESGLEDGEDLTEAESAGATESEATQASGLSDAQEVKSDQADTYDSGEVEALGAGINFEDLLEEQDQADEVVVGSAEESSLRAVRANRRRAAIKILNRMRNEAERIGIDLAALMKLRRRRGLKRLWFEQLVFALARELKFNFEQRQELARELELSSADFDDIRQAELAVRRELHARRIRNKLALSLQNVV